jgi:hypothetical protein
VAVSDDAIAGHCSWSRGLLGDQGSGTILELFSKGSLEP